MKTAAKVFLFLSNVSYGITLITSLILLITTCSYVEVGYYITSLRVTYALLLIFSSIFFIFGIISYRVVDDAVYSNEVTITRKICILLFINLIAGILLLCWNDQNINDRNANTMSYYNTSSNTSFNPTNSYKLINPSSITTTNTVTKQSTATKSNNEIDFESLEKLKKLLDMGIITQEEFDVRKKEFLKI